MFLVISHFQVHQNRLELFKIQPFTSFNFLLKPFWLFTTLPLIEVALKDIQIEKLLHDKLYTPHVPTYVPSEFKIYLRIS